MFVDCHDRAESSEFAQHYHSLSKIRRKYAHPPFSRQVVVKGHLLLESTPTLLARTGKHLNSSGRSTVNEVGLRNEGWLSRRDEAIVLFFWDQLCYSPMLQIMSDYALAISQLFSDYALDIAHLRSKALLQSEGCRDFSWSSIESTDRAELEPELELARPLESRLLSLAASPLEAM